MEETLDTVAGNKKKEEKRLDTESEMWRYGNETLLSAGSGDNEGQQPQISTWAVQAGL